LLVGPDAVFVSRRAQIVTLAARYALPAIYFTHDFAEIGGLMSYGPNLTDVYQQTGIYVGRVLKGERPADLPVVQPTKFELVVNVNTARALGIAILNTLLALAAALWVDEGGAEIARIHDPDAGVYVISVGRALTPADKPPLRLLEVRRRRGVHLLLRFQVGEQCRKKSCCSLYVGT
jgi:ABC transporter substrate binding protein